MKTTMIILAVGIAAVFVFRATSGDPQSVSSKMEGSVDDQSATSAAMVVEGDVRAPTSESAQRLTQALSRIPGDTSDTPSQALAPVTGMKVPDLGSGNPLETLAPAESELFAHNSVEMMRLSGHLQKQIENGDMTEEEAIDELAARGKEAETKMRELMGEQRFEDFEQRMLQYGEDMAQVAEVEGDEALQEEIGSAVLENEALTDRILDALDP